MSAISYAQARQLTLDRLREVMLSLPVSERPRPRYVIEFKAMSILSLIAEVERDTEIGRKYVYDTAEHLGYVLTE